MGRRAFSSVNTSHPHRARMKCKRCGAVAPKPPRGRGYHLEWALRLPGEAKLCLECRSAKRINKRKPASPHAVLRRSSADEVLRDPLQMALAGWRR